METRRVEIDHGKLHLIVKQRLKSRNRTKEYEHAKNVLHEFPIQPTEIRSNWIHNSKLYNFAKNVKFSEIMKSLIDKYSNLEPFGHNRKLTNEDCERQSSKPAVHQFVPVLSPRDAVGNEVLCIRNTLRRLGYRSEIFVERVHPEMIAESKPLTHYEVSSATDIIIYHHAAASDLVDFLVSLPGKKIMIYHNITPHEYFTGINKVTVESNRRGRDQLHTLRDKIDLAIAHSEFSRLELTEIGFRNSVVMPVLINFDIYDAKVKEDLVRKYSNSLNILFVGRLVPNKRIEDLLRVFTYYNKCVNSNSNLFIVGSSLGTQRYHAWLNQLIRDVQICNVHFIGTADIRELVTYYKIANIFVSMSEHEGFCVPLVESMHFGVPIVAFDSTAIPHTLGDAGILVKEKNFEEIGELIDTILDNDDIRTTIIEKQNERLQAFKQEKVEKMFVKHLDKVLRGS